MKIKRKSKEPDPHVINRELTEKEKQETLAYIEEYKRKQKLHKKKSLKTAYSPKIRVSEAAEMKIKYQARKKSAKKSKK